jgi:iron complex outermembrane receptor protein
MPMRLEAHAKLQVFSQPYRLYATDDRYDGGAASASIGSRAGAFSWWLALNRLASDAQPVGFVVKSVPTTASATGTPVTGAFADRNPRDSRITQNDAFPASVGKWQPRVPRWRAAMLASYAAGERWSTSVGVRYSGRQYGQLANSDTNGFAFTGFSRFLVVDLRAQYRLSPSWLLSAGVDNVTNDRYWAFHPYPQRTWHAELRHDL